MPKSSDQPSRPLLAELCHLGEAPLAHLVEEEVRPLPQALSQIMANLTIFYFINKGVS